MRVPTIDVNIFKKRRERLVELMGEGEALVLVSNPEFIRNNDVHHPYRQDTNFYYLTGFEEPESVFIFRPGKTPETVMFVRPKNEERETWDGFRYGVDGVKTFFQMDEAYDVGEFDSVGASLLNECESVYYRNYQHPEFDPRFNIMMNQVKSLRGRSSKGYLTVKDSYALVSELRLFKGEYEVRMMERAAQISAEAHVMLMRATQPGVNERALHGLFIKEILQRGAAREAYGSIVAGGNNATTLHYVFNDQPLEDGELVLIDAGAEYNYYAGDITRTYPINGRFTEPQKRLYVKVLDVQKTIINMIKPGLKFKELQDKAIDMLTDIMLSEGLLKGDKKTIIENAEYKKYYPHGVSHWLGSDVHDAGMYEQFGESRELEEGMAFTVEPGIYIPMSDSSAPDELKGIGIRIEDNIRVTNTGHVNMSAAVPKEPQVIEEIVGSRLDVWE